MFFMDYWKNRHHHKHEKYCEIREHGTNGKPSEAIEHENLSQKLSDVHNSSVGVNSVILHDPDSIKEQRWKWDFTFSGWLTQNY